MSFFVVGNSMERTPELVLCRGCFDWIAEDMHHHGPARKVCSRADALAGRMRCDWGTALDDCESLSLSLLPVHIFLPDAQKAVFCVACVRRRLAALSFRVFVVIEALSF